MKVCEIFTSIQGESSYVGMPCTFIRFSGCNLNCDFCDTPEARNNGMELSEDEIFNEVSLIGVNLIEITGGEPLLQDGVFHLIEGFLNDGHTVLLETNGSMSIREVDTRTKIILDIKTPGSGMSDEMDLSNLDYIKPDDEIKFVLTNRDDYEWAKQFISDHNIFARCRVLLSPAFGVLSPEILSKWMVEDRLPVRLNIQIHKYIFASDRRAV